MFNQFRSTYRFPDVWPITPQTLSLFIAYCYENSLAPRSIRTYVSGINYYQKLMGGQDLENVFVIKKILEGCLRSRPNLPDQRRPITKPILLAICNQLPLVCYNGYEATLFKAAFLLAYYGLFRVSELILSQNKSACIVQSNISIENQNSKLRIQLINSKNNQRGRQISILIPKECDSTCPVDAVRRFMAVRPCINGPFFCHSDGRPATRFQFEAVLHKCLLRTQFASQYFRSHSFRIGRATDLARKGMPQATIMQMGRWQSSAVNFYIR